jgi:hypothetical protein
MRTPAEGLPVPFYKYVVPACKTESAGGDVLA